MTSPRRAAGWSLIEAVVALAILALALGTTYQVLSAAARRAALVQHYAEALALAESKLAEAATGAALIRGAQSGITEQRFEWLRSVEPYSSDDELAEPPEVVRYRIKVEVRWALDGQQRSLALSSVRLRYAS
jgi:general secretion pathway protein I